jgi:transcriptional regulator with XRE-family HTH domain
MAKEQQSFSQRLKEARTKAGLSQYELARRSGVSRDVIAQCEAGKIMRPKGLEELAKVLGVSPAWLAFGDDRIDKISKEGLELALLWEDMTHEQKTAIETMIRSLSKD